jgi:fused signal recognition particle receptor
VSAGYPEARDEAATWIASPALRAEMLGEWPVAAPPVTPPAEEHEPEVDPDPWTHAEELPVAPLGELEPEPEPEQPLPVVAATEPELVPPPVSLPVEPEPAPEPEPEPAAEPEPSLDVELTRSAHGVARHSLDPLGDVQPRRRFGRGAAPEPAAVEVPARPDGVRALPGRTNRQD